MTGPGDVPTPSGDASRDATERATQASPPDGAAPDADEALVADLFARFIDDLGAGRAPDLDAACADRPDLRSRVASVLALAAEVAVAKPAERPRIAGHEILGEIGRGGMGTVYLALDRDLRRRVALKVLPSSWAAGPRGRERFLREARAVARLQHAAIVPVYDMGEDDGTPWFTMEWIEGRTLADVIARLRSERPRPPRDAADIARAAGLATTPDGTYARACARLLLGIAEGLAHAHAAGVVHRDVKPSNVIVRPDGRALLCDFGLAQVESEASLTMTGSFLGTPHYASPEQAAGRADVDARTDVWSLGATLHELLVLAPPFSGATAQEVLLRVSTVEAPPLRSLDPSIPADLATIVATAMEKDPAKRYLSGAELAADLRRFLAGEPVAARPVGPLGRASRWARRRPAVAASLALAFLLVVGAPTALYLQQRAANTEIAAKHDDLVKARDAARRSLDAAEAHNAFVQEMLAAVEPGKDGRDVRVADLLTRGVGDVRTRFADRPDVRWRLQRTIGASLRALGLTEQATEVFAEAAASAAADSSAAIADALTLRNDHAVLLYEGGDLEAALLASRGILADATAQLGDEHAITVDAAIGVAGTLRSLGRHDEAAEILEGAATRTSGTGDRMQRARMGVLHNLALVRADQGRAGEALRLMRSAWEGRKAAFGERDDETLMSLATLPQLAKEARDASAHDLSREAVRVLRDVLGPDHGLTGYALHNEAGHLIDEGKWDEALPVQTAAVAAISASFGPGAELHAIARGQLVRVHAGLGRTDDAVRDGEALFAEVEADREPQRESALIVRGALADAYVGARRLEEAERLLSAERIGTDDSLAPGTLVGILRARLGVYEAWGRRERADEIRAKLGQPRK